MGGHRLLQPEDRTIQSLFCGHGMEFQDMIRRKDIDVAFGSFQIDIGMDLIGEDEHKIAWDHEKSPAVDDSVQTTWL